MAKPTDLAARGMYFGTCPNVGHDEAHACPTENKTNSICLKFLVKYRERQGNRMRTRVIDGWRLFHCATLTSPELRVQVVDNNIVVTLPDYSYAVTYSTPMGLPVCS